MSVKIRAQLEHVRQQLDDLRQRYAEVQFALKFGRLQLEDLQGQDPSIAALNTILEQINELEDQNGSRLLWGEDCTEEQARQNRRRVETLLKDYDTRVSGTEQRIKALLRERAGLERRSHTLQAQYERLQAELKSLPGEPARRAEQAPAVMSPVVLPWSNRRSDAKRLRIIMLAALVLTVVLGTVVPRWELPEPERADYIEIPQRLATLILKKAPPPPPPLDQQPPEETKQPEAVEEAESTAEETDTSKARKTAEKTGLLAFKQDFAAMMDASADIKLGSQAAILTNAQAERRQQAERSLITSQVDFSSTGAAPVSARRQDVIGHGNTLKKVEFTHIENQQVAALDRKQLETNTQSATQRSDEEIQVVFDRYKDALYRIYSRELRKDSFLKGKLVLQLTIEPNGKVSKCTIASSTLNSTELENKVVARVLRFNFGEKKDAKPLTIRYPIDFLPAT